jgi:hypothetical protein
MHFAAYPLDYFLLRDAIREGATVATFAGEPVAEAVRDAHGRRFLFAGLAPRRRDGRYDLAALHAGEFILQPGLVYRWEGIVRT